MSAPTPAPGDDRPREGYYPDPSIPGYVRYWNGASWVPGTSRPAPSAGESLPTPPGGRSAPAATGPGTTEETGPHFFDEDPPAAAPSPAEAQHGSRPEPATAWGADRSRQTGFGGEQDRRVSWGSPADPRLPSEPAQPEGRSEHTDGTVSFRAPRSEDRVEDQPRDTQGAQDTQPQASGGTAVFRRPTGRVRPAAGSQEEPSASPQDASHGSGSPRPRAGASGVPSARNPLASEGTMAFRAVTPRQRQLRDPQVPGPTAGGTAVGGTASGGSTTGSTAGSPAAARAGLSQGGSASAAGAQSPAVPAQSTNSPAPQSAPSTPSTPEQSTPMAAGVGGGQPSWAQQVHRLAGAESEPPVVPWKPVSEDPFQAAARAQASARPAGLGKRLAARLVDSLVLIAVTGAAAVPLGTRALDHVNDKIDAAKLSGETVTVWLLDATTGAYLGIVLAVLLLFGVLYEALPTAKWGRTLGKKLCGLQVRDIEGGEPPSFGAALRRWLVYSVPGLLGIGALGVLWGLFDRPWRQCWHDKAAHTFVAG
ncbi:RDD family protein [Streptomyces xiangluensis]|uniref:RDD family protein n=1 Tax=Streptomyces xiangluensis TaxID=2665720 RepID=A0ABV8Z3U1_9ACTN